MNRKTRPKRPFYPRVARLLAALVSVLLAQGCTKNPSAGGGRGADRNAPVAVRLASVRIRDLRLTLDYTANVMAQDEAVVYSRVPGKIMEKCVEDGAPVKKGDILAWVDRDEVGLRYEKAPVESPLSGLVGRVYVDRGVSVTPQTPLAVVVNLDSVRVRLDVPEKYLPQLSTNLTAQISVDAWPDMVFTGQVSYPFLEAAMQR